MTDPAARSPARRSPTLHLPARRPARLRRPAATADVAVRWVLAVAAFLVFCWACRSATIPIGLGRRRAGPAGTGDRGTPHRPELRLPRALAGLLVGVAFGVSGALFQTMTRNPLASPDMIGITQGAGAAVVAGIVLGWDGGPGHPGARPARRRWPRRCWCTCWRGSAARPATASSWSASASPGSAPAPPTT